MGAAPSAPAPDTPPRPPSAFGGAARAVVRKWRDRSDVTPVSAPTLASDALARWREVGGRTDSDTDALVTALRADNEVLRAALAALARALGERALGDDDDTPGALAAGGHQTGTGLDASHIARDDRPATAPTAVSPPPPPRPPPPRPAPPPDHPLSPSIAAWLAAHELLLAQARDAARTGRSRDALAALDALCAREGVSAAELQPFAPSLAVDPADIVARADELGAVQAALADESDYTVARDEAGLSVLYKHAPGSPLHAVRFEALLDAPLLHVVAMLVEIDTMPAWNKFCVEAAIVARGAFGSAVVYSASWVPPPFPQFDVTVRVRAHDAGDPSPGFILAMESVDGVAGVSGVAVPSPAPADAAALAARPPRAAKRHACFIARGSCIRLLPVTPGAGGRPRTHATLAVSLDPRLPYVPRFLVAWVLRVLSPYVLRAVQRVMATWFEEEGVGVEQGGSPRRAPERTLSRARSQNKHAGALTARIAARRPEYDAIQALVDARIAERGGVLPAPPARRAFGAGADAPLPRGSALLRRVSTTAGDAVAAVARGSATLVRRLSSAARE